jgi:F0F1-type ATP synthase membrane subunit c/vacuolar-type H+-ATPase subunit K
MAYPSSMPTVAGKPRTLLRASVSALAAGLLIAAAGCGSAIRGRVVTGSIGRAMVVDPSDTRLEGPGGVAGVRVEIRGSDGRSVLASTTSGADGSFRATLPKNVVLRGSIVAHAQSPGVFLTQTQVTVPTEAQRLLVLVQPREGTPRE